MRTFAAALVALTFIACVARQPPKEQLTFERIERVYEYLLSKPVRPAEGNVFVIVHLVEDPAREETRDWIDSVMEDWDGRTYQAKFAGVNGGESESQGLFGRKTRTVHPDRVHVVFEVPQRATLRSVTVPHPFALSPEKPVRVRRGQPAPRVVHRVEPYYPEWARRQRIDGLVKLEVFVTPEGTVGGAKNIHGHPVLGDAAAAAVRQWKYEPLAIEGNAVPAIIEEHINFRLN